MNNDLIARLAWSSDDITRQYISDDETIFFEYKGQILNNDGVEYDVSLSAYRWPVPFRRKMKDYLCGSISAVVRQSDSDIELSDVFVNRITGTEHIWERYGALEIKGPEDDPHTPIIRQLMSKLEEAVGING